MRLLTIRMYTDPNTGRRLWAVCDARTGEALVICKSYGAAAGLL